MSLVLETKAFKCFYSTNFGEGRGGGIIQVKLNSRLWWQKQQWTRRRFFFAKKLSFNLRKNLVKFSVWSVTLHGAETWTLRKVDQKYLQDFEMWCSRRMEISWTDRVSNEEVLHRVKEERNFLQ
jgi:hypothetical protein